MEQYIISTIIDVIAMLSIMAILTYIFVELMKGV